MQSQALKFTRTADRCQYRAGNPGYMLIRKLLSRPSEPTSMKKSAIGIDTSEAEGKYNEAQQDINAAKALPTSQYHYRIE